MYLAAFSRTEHNAGSQSRDTLCRQKGYRRSMRRELHGNSVTAAHTILSWAGAQQTINRLLQKPALFGARVSVTLGKNFGFLWFYLFIF